MKLACTCTNCEALRALKVKRGPAVPPFLLRIRRAEGLARQQRVAENMAQSIRNAFAAHLAQHREPAPEVTIQ